MELLLKKLQSLKFQNHIESDILTLPDGTQLILSTLTESENRSVSDYIRQFLDRSVTLYMKTDTLAHAIKWIKSPAGDEINLREISHLETGETLSNGVSVKVTKVSAVRDLLDSWPDIIIESLFYQYMMITLELETKIQKKILVEVEDVALQLKIKDAEETLAKLKAEAAARGISQSINKGPTRDEGSNPIEGDRLLEALKSINAETDPTKVQHMRHKPIIEQPVDLKV